MAFQDDLIENPSPPITHRAVNGKGGTYWVKIAMERNAAGKFLRELWQFVDGSCVPNSEEDALGEWTDRSCDVRSTFSSYDGILIRTHAWSPESDRNTLDDRVLSFLRSRGMEV